MTKEEALINKHLDRLDANNIIGKDGTIYKGFLNAVNEALTIPVVKNWVEVKDELPESGQCVMIYSKDGGVAEGAYLSAKGHFEQWRWNAIQKDVTHWKPLCEPPCL